MNARIKWQSHKLRKEFYSLKQRDPSLFKHINRALDSVEEYSTTGNHIRKKLIPKEWTHYNNIWKYNLPNGWRLFYHLKTVNEEIVAIVIAFMSHKEYERLFKYS